VTSNANNPLTREELLYRAAQCYRHARLEQDALRLYEILKDYRQIAQYHENQQHWSIAARYYIMISEWENTARCYQRAGMHDKEAEARLRAGTPIQAAWLWAHYVHQYRRALATIVDIDITEIVVRLQVELIQARCDAGMRQTKAAARRIRAVAANFNNSSLRTSLPRLFEWSLDIVMVMQRYDLAQELHAAYLETGIYNSLDIWTKWAEQILGNAAFVAFLASPMKSDGDASE
jgi:hypothetical protein